LNVKKPGFGMIETLISSALILFLIVATAQLLVLSLAAKRKADFHFAAATLASAKLEYLKSLDFEGPELGPSPHDETLSYGPTGLSYQAEWRTEPLAENAKKVILVISAIYKPAWQAEFCLLISRELGF
jgi:hypothetical protein